MSSKLSLLVLLLIISLNCFGQVTVTGGTASWVGPSAAVSPLIATPEIALPGSGSPVGAPLSSSAANDSRFSRTPSVSNPNGSDYVVSMTNSAAAIPKGNGENASRAERFEVGIQNFESGLTNAGPRLSVAEIARSYRQQPHHATRSYTNESIAQMNANAAPIPNLGIENAMLTSSALIVTAAAQERAPAIPESDREAVSEKKSPIRPHASKLQHSNRPSNENASAPSLVTRASAPLSTTDQSSVPSKLPDTRSPGFLLWLIGGAALVGSVLYWLRRRVAARHV
ncbi:MAG TPA: hypothetical protein VG498_06780 [Terriglobales bacterium]|nr:hypothetical protein [Terriglobales bacterium]